MPLDEAGAHRVGRLLAVAGATDVVDAAVAAEARARPAAMVVTSDRGDIEQLVGSADARVVVIDV